MIGQECKILKVKICLRKVDWLQSKLVVKLEIATSFLSRQKDKKKIHLFYSFTCIVVEGLMV